MDPELIKDLKTLNKSLHASNLSTRNRILSILKDFQFTLRIKNDNYPTYPIIPNDRCGRWYINSTIYKGLTPSYFKSTDGHTNNWSFSTRRLNLHLLKTIATYKGLIIIDSTRRGKKIPDSLSKTIPIWISIINKFIDVDKSFHDTLVTPVETVSRYEHDRILDLMPDFYSNLEKFKDLIMDKINESKIDKVLKPFWIYPHCTMLPTFTGTEDYIPIILISVSEMFQDGENKCNGYTYVQGAGDDHELWSPGLTPELFWANIDDFDDVFNMNDLQVDELIDSMVLKEKEKVGMLNDNNLFWCDDDGADGVVQVNEYLSFGKIEKNVTFQNDPSKDLKFDKIFVLESTFNVIKEDNEEEDDDDDDARIFKFDLDSGSKKSSKLLRLQIPRIMQLYNPLEKTLVLCNNGEDMSVAIILCMLNYGKYKLDISKETIRRDLIRLIDLKKVNPQRATLNSVNSYLLS